MQTVLTTYADGSRIERDDSDHWAANMRWTLVDPDGCEIRRGPEWKVRLIAHRRGLTPL